MQKMLLLTPQILKLLEMSLIEDIGTGDITTNSLIGPEVIAKGVIIAKSDLVLSGLELAEAVFHHLDPALEFSAISKDGSRLQKGDRIAEIEGKARPILTGERLALNFLQRLSGIATYTAKYVSLIQGYQVEILDTRKTTPGWRTLEKYAVRVGGGRNHRFNLSQGVLIKNNHLALTGSVREAVQRARQALPPLLKIEVEVESLAQIEEALEAKADAIMLDNMSCTEMAEAVKYIAGRAWVEASGAINEDNIEAVAQTGVNFISLGRLTHSAPAVDIHLRIETQ
jgi:nicotinate-nucleotide pyrophosphorylase (carboxylating)